MHAGTERPLQRVIFERDNASIYSILPTAMAKAADQGEKYDQYLEHLINDAQSLGSDFNNFTKLWRLLDHYLDEINEAPGTFGSIINSLRTSTVVYANRLFDASSVGLHELIKLARVHRDAIDWKGGAPSDERLQSQSDRIAD